MLMSRVKMAATCRGFVVGMLLVAFSAAGLFGAGQASAGIDFYVNVHNNSPYSVKLLGGDNFCWYIGDLDGNAAPAIAAPEQGDPLRI